VVPLLGQVEVKIIFRPERPSPEPAITAAKAETGTFGERGNAAAAADAVDIFRKETGFSGALRDEAEPVGITGDLHGHFPNPLSLELAWGRQGCLTTEERRSVTTFTEKLIEFNCLIALFA
jgi:hypothetical protein